WIQNGPAGFVKDKRKTIYDPINELVLEYDLNTDPDELAGQELTDQQARQVIEEITAWRGATILPTPKKRTGQARLFERWLCNWNNRKAWAKYLPNKPATVR
ncbi:unnamed protein product, partial [marine sediment metagenome]